MSSALDEVSIERMENKLQHSNWLGFPKPEQQAWLGNGSSKVIAVNTAEVVDRRCQSLFKQKELIRGLTNFYWWPQGAA